jgi:parallel beta-helix repeat protein
MIQIDVAAPATAPVLKGTSLLNGAACENIYILNNTVTGARAVGANYAKKDGGNYLNSFHRNIVVKNNNLTGKTSEGLVLFNVGGGTVSGNTIISKSARTSTAYSIGCQAAIFGNAPSWMKASRLYITGNTIKGGRQAVQVYSHTSSKFGYVTVTGNKLYCRKGAQNALKAVKAQTVSLNAAGNNTYNWNGK